MIKINMSNDSDKVAFLTMGFRPLFLAASLSAVLLMLLWLINYQQNMHLSTNISAQLWHAHEMIFGYTVAVIIGFLLTATTNWTKLTTLQGWPLLILFLIWLIARIIFIIGNITPLLQAIIDTSFLFIAAIAIALPIITTTSWQHIGIVAKIILMFCAHLVFYLGVLGIIDNGVLIGIYSAFYLILSLIFVMMRRVVPFFIERALNVKIKNYRYLDISSLVLFIIYVALALFIQTDIIFIVALLLTIVHSIRLILWHHIKIWQKPLLWSLYVAYIFLVIAFFLHTISYFINISPYIIIHSFAVGIAMITISMMSRVILGHTNRNVMQPPKIILISFLLIILVFIARVILPIFYINFYTIWVVSAQILWILAFIIWTVPYIPMLINKNK